MKTQKTKRLLRIMCLINHKMSIFYHSKRVVKLCKIFIKHINPNHKKIIKKSAWLHDIGKVLGNDNHDNIDVIKYSLKRIGYTDKKIDKIIYLIQWHGGEAFKPEKLQLQCSILRICDKLDKFMKDKKKSKKRRKKIIKNCTENMKQIKNIIETHPDFQAFYQLYNKLFSYLEARY